MALGAFRASFATLRANPRQHLGILATGSFQGLGAQRAILCQRSCAVTRASGIELVLFVAQQTALGAWQVGADSWLLF